MHGTKKHSVEFKGLMNPSAHLGELAEHRNDANSRMGRCESLSEFLEKGPTDK
jgi:hypothetical protein